MLESRAFSGVAKDLRPVPITCGAVAQLGERRVRNAKVEGSSPFVSNAGPEAEMAFPVLFSGVSSP